MKFEYQDQDATQCVAYIDLAGCLRMRDTGRAEDRRGAICLRTDGELKNGYVWEPDAAQRRFYPGDKITITF